MTQGVHSQLRFGGQAASPHAQRLAGAITLSMIATVSALSIATGTTVATFFAVGAGAGYSLSGSV